ncbi:hypothetical protein RPHASCH2410_PC00315 (plasmid) [Rhizobium phaseoli Ch24-10]|nr:hypothetical protein RPHASCH2410_PC00315 [Rhizobium phaseoli Ch24-10]
MPFLPTPIEKLDRLGKRGGGNIKNNVNEMTTSSELAFGGNKLRKLYYRRVEAGPV